MQLSPDKKSLPQPEEFPGEPVRNEFYGICTKRQLMGAD